jgi:hypothetical protein
VNRLT